MIKSVKQLYKELTKWSSSDDETDPIVKIPISIIKQFKHKVEEDMYLYILKSKKEELEKRIRNLEI